MEKVILEMGEQTLLKIDAVGGDLRLSGREGKTLEAQAPDHGKLTVEEKNGVHYLTCRSGCLVFLPKGTRIEVENIGGDGRLTDIEDEVLIRNIGGDLVLRRVGRASFELVGGDMQVKSMTGDLTVDVLGGDAVIQDVTGSVHLRSVGGDLILDGVHGKINCSAGGDISANIGPGTVGPTSIHAGGDLACRLMEGVSARIQVQAGGDLHLPLGLERDESNVIVIEGGKQEIELSAGSDLSVRVGTRDMGAPEDFVGDILLEVDAKLAEMEARFSALGAGLDSFDADRIGERVRRAVRRAQRKSEQAERKAIKAQVKLGKIDIPKMTWAGGDLNASSRKQEATDEERLAILKMVEEGKINVDEAENLFKALEGEL
jgi:hypothetical protein